MLAQRNSYSMATEKENKTGHSTCGPTKRKAESSYDSANTDRAKRQNVSAARRQTTLPFTPSRRKDIEHETPKPSCDTDSPPMSQIIETIRTHPSLTPFRKRLYETLLSVPKGQYTTYQALADHLGSSARAVGNGMRNNPFAPAVPCHRVLASDRNIGGFGGDWGKEGKHAGKKVELLTSEGVKFDSAGKVKGPVWGGFKKLALIGLKAEMPEDPYACVVQGGGLQR